MDKEKREVKRIVDELLVRLSSKGIEINKLILFGSRARAEAGPFSDWDVAVVSKSFNRTGLLRRQELLGEAIWQMTSPVEILGYSLKEYESASRESFISTIRALGQIVYEN
jgi:predicted nucleotidyltransferase